MDRKNIRFILDLLNAPPSTASWVRAMMDEITESIEDVPDASAVLVISELEAADEQQA